jgi:type III pantothenate kinase
MLGGRVQQSGDLLVVDAGTALTIDLFSSDNQHQGGYIVPGLRMAQNALFSGTDRVRAYQDEQDKQEIAPGKNTLNCVAAGVLRQNLALVQSLLDEYPEHQPLITGGDGQLLASRLGLSYSPDLIFDGMDSLCAGSSIV